MKHPLSVLGGEAIMDNFSDLMGSFRPAPWRGIKIRQKAPQIRNVGGAPLSPVTIQVQDAHPGRQGAVKIGFGAISDHKDVF